MSRTLLLALILGTGCHAKFKKAAPTLGSVGVQVVTTGAPSVDLGTIPATNTPIDVIVDVAKEVGENTLEERIAKAVEVTEVEAAFAQGIAAALGSGPPFAYTDAADAPAKLQVEVTSYGLASAGLGASGEFSYALKARIYRANGERVYKYSTTCTPGAQDADTAGQIVQAIENVRKIDKMSKAEMNDLFVETARYCGRELVLRMREHAG